MLSEVARGFKLGDEPVCSSQLPREIQRFKAMFLGYDLLNLDGERFVSLLLAIKEL
jgi:hypothetical protein